MVLSELWPEARIRAKCKGIAIFLFASSLAAKKQLNPNGGCPSAPLRASFGPPSSKLFRKRRRSLSDERSPVRRLCFLHGTALRWACPAQARDGIRLLAPRFVPARATRAAPSSMDCCFFFWLAFGLRRPPYYCSVHPSLLPLLPFPVSSALPRAPPRNIFSSARHSASPPAAPLRAWRPAPPPVAWPRIKARRSFALGQRPPRAPDSFRAAAAFAKSTREFNAAQRFTPILLRRVPQPPASPCVARVDDATRGYHDRQSQCRDSSVGRASDRRSEGPRFDPGSRHFSSFASAARSIFLTRPLRFLPCLFSFIPHLRLTMRAQVHKMRAERFELPTF